MADEPVLFKKKKIKGNIRKREILDEPEDESQGDVIKRKTSKPQSSAFLTSSSQQSKKPKDEIAGIQTVSFAASGTAASLASNEAFRSLDVDGIEEPQVAIVAGEEAEEGTYRGLANYKQYVNKSTSNVTQSNASRIRAGPLKGTSNVRISCRFDYQPDVCKDYKETGYCGYGDSCKFMHDRGDYKTGWQLEQEWNEKERLLARERVNKEFIEQNEVVEEGESDDDLPFACLLCRGDFKSPIVTNCKHYFCEACAIKHHRKSPKCFACGLATGGIFNVAYDIIKKLEEKQKRIEEISRQVREKVGDIGEGGDEDSHEASLQD